MAGAISDARVKLEAHAKQAERRGSELSDALRENARTMAELDAIFTSAPVGFAFHDRDLRYVRVNERLATAMGHTPDEIIGRRPSEVLPGIGADIEEGLSRALATDQAVLEVLASGQYLLGKTVDDLESDFCRYLGTSSAIGVSSGTEALLLALGALGIGPGDEVITSAFSFIASATCIARCGARPVFVDIDPETYQMDADGLAAAITPRTRAIIAGWPVFVSQ